MLLNGSHKPTFSGLPPDLRNVYDRYKRYTGALITWFQKQDCRPGKVARSLTVKELEAQAEEISGKLKVLPDEVHFYFREVIADRTRLTKYYRTQVDETANNTTTAGHIHFTATLERIYLDLRARCGEPTWYKQRSHPITCQPPLPTPQYSELLVEETEDHHEYDAQPPEAMGHLIAAHMESTPGEKNEPVIHLADDELCKAFEVVAAMQRIQGLSSSITGYWALVAKGKLSFVVASFMTNVVFASLRQIVNDLLQHNENLTVSTVVEMCSSFRGIFETELRTQKITGTNTSLLSRLEDIEEILPQCTDGEESISHDISCPRCGQAFAHDVHTQIINGSGGSQSLRQAIVKNMVDWVSSKAVPVNAIMTRTPLYAAVAEDLSADDKNDKDSWAAVLGLDLLTQSYRVFLKTLKPPSSTARSRITALKLAQQAHCQITVLLEHKTYFPCQCSETLGYHLQHMATTLRNYASHNCWDLVFQSPWVAGNHILEILDLCNYYGHHLLKYRYYVGAVFHSYNVLTQLCGLEQIPILEKICKQFCGILFPGGNTPRNNFYPCFIRYVGARLKFNDGHRGNDHIDSWCLAIPAHDSRTAAGIGIPDHNQQDRSGCVLFHIKQQDYHVSDAQWRDFDTIHGSACSRKDIGEKVNLDPISKIRPVQNQKQKLLTLAVEAQAMFTGRSGEGLPTARVSLFALFEKCARVVSIVSGKMHDEQKAVKDEPCVCFCTGLVSGADRLVKGRRFDKLEAWKKDERKVVDDTKQAILEAFGTIKEGDLLWNV